eukprot:3496007-Pleurochrysis_carterae.AAC.1
MFYVVPVAKIVKTIVYMGLRAILGCSAGFEVVAFATPKGTLGPSRRHSLPLRRGLYVAFAELCKFCVSIEEVRRAEQAAVSAQRKKNEAELYKKEYTQLNVALNRHDAAFRALHRGKGPKRVAKMSEEHMWAYERRHLILQWYPTLSELKRKEMGLEK